MARRPAKLRSVFRRALHAERRALFGWSAGMATYAFVMTAMFPTIRSNPQITNLYRSYPEALRAMFSMQDLSTGSGFIRTEIFSVVAPLLLTVFAVLWGSDLVAGEEDRGTIDILLANPISRTRVLLESWAALGVGVGAVALGLWVGLEVGNLAFDCALPASSLIAACTATGLLAFCFGSMALAFGAGTGGRGLARGLTVALLVVSYLLATLAELISWIKPLRPISPWYHAMGVDPLGTGWRYWHLGIVLGVAALVTTIGLSAYRNRDLAT